MELIRTLDEVRRRADVRGGVVAIGNFDGVHRGHAAMVATLVQIARSEGVPAIVLTFDPHPIALLAPDRLPPSLSTLERKAELLERAGADVLVVCRTTRDLLDLSAVAFFDTVLRETMNARGLVEGPNFHFGKDRRGDVALLRTLCDAHGMLLQVLEPVDFDGGMVSSSRIRRAINGGDLAAAVRMLGHPYEMRGTVIRGDGRGRTLGYATANLSGVSTLLPPDGVYASVCEVADRLHAAAVNVGGNPTFGVETRKVEVHILDFDGDLYGCPLRVRLVDRIRGTVAFADSAELTSQITRDVRSAREAAAGHLEQASPPSRS